MEFLAIPGLLAAALTALGAFKLRGNHPVIWQFSRFTNHRPGIKDNANWLDEPDVVEYDDFRYWVRLRPNPGINLPLVGYWSKAKGRKGP